MGKPDTPQPPDPQVTAAAQTAQNIGTAIANNQMQMVDQVTPWGNLTYEQTDTYNYTDPNATQTQSFGYLMPTVTQQGGTVQPGSKSGGKPIPDGWSPSTGPTGPAVSGGMPLPNLNPYNTGGGTTAPLGVYPTSATTSNSGGTYEIPRYTATVTLPKEQQAALDAQFATNNVLSQTALEQSQFLNNYLNTQMDVSGLPDTVSQVDPLRQQYGINGNLRIDPTLGGAGQGIQRQVGGQSPLQSQVEGANGGPKTYGGDFSENRREVEDALMQRMDPYLDRNRAALETRLSNQGITPGSEAYNNAMMDLERQENDARLGAILSASEEQARLTGMERDRAAFESNAQAQGFGQNLAAGQFYNQSQGQQFGQNAQAMALANQAQAQGFNQNAQAAQFQNQAQAQDFQQQAQNSAMFNAANQAAFNSQMSQAGLTNAARNQMLQEQFALRNQPINEITAILSGAQVQNPGLQSVTPGGIPTTDYAGIVANNYNQQLGAYNAEMGNYNSLMGGLFGLGSSMIGMF